MSEWSDSDRACSVDWSWQPRTARSQQALQAQCCCCRWLRRYLIATPLAVWRSYARNRQQATRNVVLGTFTYTRTRIKRTSVNCDQSRRTATCPYWYLKCGSAMTLMWHMSDIVDCEIYWWNFPHWRPIFSSCKVVVCWSSLNSKRVLVVVLVGNVGPTCTCTCTRGQCTWNISAGNYCRLQSPADRYHSLPCYVQFTTCSLQSPRSSHTVAEANFL